METKEKAEEKKDAGTLIETKVVSCKSSGFCCKKWLRCEQINHKRDKNNRLFENSKTDERNRQNKIELELPLYYNKISDSEQAKRRFEQGGKQ